MAKNHNQHTDSFDTDDSGGVLSGLLAEEDEFDRRALWRIGSWGVGATGAVILAVMANQSSISMRRDQVAAVDLTRQAQQIQSVAKETQNEARRLASAIDTLNGDRDRLYTRVTSLEQGLDSVTGAIVRQGAPAASAEPHTLVQNPSAPAVGSVASVQPVAPPAEKSPAGAVEANPAAVWSVAKDTAKTETVKADIAKADPPKAEAGKTQIAKLETAKVEIAKPEAAKPELAKTETARSEMPKPDAAKPDMAKPEAAKPEATKASPATPLVAAQSMMAPPDPAAPKLIETGKALSPVSSSPIPEVVASVTADTDDEAMAPKVALQRTEFGVDLGSANSVGGLRALWRGLIKSKSNAQLAALRPIIVVKEGTNGLGLQLRLVAGPLNDAGTAARICAVMAENDRPCETAIFDGQRLSLKSDDTAPAAGKPESGRRGKATKRSAAVEEAPKKPEPSSTFSSFFNRKNAQ